MRQATAIVPTPVSTVAEADLRAALAERLGDSKYGVWFGEGTSLGVEGDAIRVAVPNGFFREWIASHYAANLIEAAESLAGRPLRLDFRIDAGDVQAEPTALAGPIGPAHRLTRPLAEVPAPTLAFPSAVPSTPRPAAPIARSPRSDLGDGWRTSSSAREVGWRRRRPWKWPGASDRDSIRW